MKIQEMKVNVHLNQFGLKGSKTKKWKGNNFLDVGIRVDGGRSFGIWMRD